MNALTLYRVDPVCTMRRFYRLDVQPDLFGLWLFIREWAGSDGQGRRAKRLSCPPTKHRRLLIASAAPKSVGDT
jgi:hypothetical protein